MWIFQAASPWGKRSPIFITMGKTCEYEGGAGCAGTGFHRSVRGKNGKPGKLPETVKGIKGYNLIDDLLAANILEY